MTDEVPYSDFAKLNLRVGKILKIEDHPKADKLYILIVDVGEEKPRTIVAGIKPYYKKDELKNKKAVFITNLEPRELRGIKSEGMILAAESPSRSKVCILTPDDAEIEIGSTIK